MSVCCNRARCWLPLFFGMIGLITLVMSSTPAHAAQDDSAPIVTIQFHVHLRTRPFWLNYIPPSSRYLGTLDACVDPMFATIHSHAYDFGNCFVLQDAKPGYDPITLPGDNDYLRTHDITYWTQAVQVVLPDQFAHTLDLTTQYVFHDREQADPDGQPLALSQSVVLSSEITVSAADDEIEAPMDGLIPADQEVHFVFHPVGAYDRSLSFWGCLRRPAEGIPSAYCGKMATLPDGSFQLDAQIPAVSQPENLFGADVDPLLEGANIQMTIVAALPGAEMPDAQPAPPGLRGHPANQIVTSAGSLLDCAMASALVYANQTLECSAAIKHDTLGQLYLSPTQVNAYIGAPPSFAQKPCLICTTTQPWPYAGPVLLALILLLVGAGGTATLMYLGRVPISSNRPLIHQPTFVATVLLALICLVFCVRVGVDFRAGYQPVVPGQVILKVTPGASPVANDVPPTPTPTPSPTPTPTPTATPTPNPTLSPSPTP